MNAPQPAPELTLRTYTQEDFETLFEIDQACYDPEVAYSRRELRNYLRFPSADCVVAEIAGRIVGFCITASRGTGGYIVTIDVLAAHRRSGVGAALLAEVEQRMARAGVVEIRLETATDNHSAIAFWNKHGYRTLGVWKNYYPGGRDAYAMSKPISPIAPPAKKRSKQQAI
jgi:[ribosomal protein S18]-alanine N-acetyltransferase